MKRLENKIVFITGGLSGIGKACALAAAREGANVAIADLKSENSLAVLKEIHTLNTSAIFIECNVASYDETHMAIKKVIETFGGMDVALNNAGIGGVPGKVGEMSDKEWHAVINVNLNGVFHCMKHELVEMAKAKKGSIINMSSILGKVGFASSAHYVAAKHGVIGLTKAAAIEYATEGIRINAICPGFIETPLLAKAGITENVEIKQHIVELHPIKRLGTSEEIAMGFIFLASEESSFVTGTTLAMDGGYLAI